jgi:hypothetical protein
MYHSWFISKMVTETSQIFLRDTHILPKSHTLSSTLINIKVNSHIDLLSAYIYCTSQLAKWIHYWHTQTQIWIKIDDGWVKMDKDWSLISGVSYEILQPWQAVSPSPSDRKPSGVSAVNSKVTYDNHGGKREELFLN